MQFKSTFILLIVFLLLGAYVYFVEYDGDSGDTATYALEIEPDEIEAIRLRDMGQTIAAVRRGVNDWEITDPPGVEADAAEWEALASSLARIVKDGVIAPAGSENVELGQYGLDEPPLAVAMTLADGVQREVLFGAENPGRTARYAMLDAGEVFLTPASASQGLQKTLFDLRNKTVLDIDPAVVEGIRITGAGGVIEMNKEAMDWTLTAPVADRADPAEVQALLSAIRFARALDFVDDSDDSDDSERSADSRSLGLEPPAATVALRDGAGGEQVLLIGSRRQGAVQEELYFAKDASRPAIFVIDDEIPGKLARSVFDWRDKSLVEFDRNALDEIRILRSGEETVLRRSGSDWISGAGDTAPPEAVSAMLDALELERVLGIIDTPRSLSVYGLDRPALDVRLFAAGNEVLRLQFGLPSSNPPGVYAMVSAGSSVKVVSLGLFEALSSEF